MFLRVFHWPKTVVWPHLTSKELRGHILSVSWKDNGKSCVSQFAHPLKQEAGRAGTRQLEATHGPVSCVTGAGSLMFTFKELAGKWV